MDRMDRTKKRGSSKAMAKVNNNMYMTFKEIIREHALRFLPAKSLYRSNAVCKDWKALISHPLFKHNQPYFFRSLSGLFCQTLGGPLSFISLDPMAYGIPEINFLPEPVDLLASSNGLVCCQGQVGDKPYYIFNPVNKHWKQLPKPEADHGLIPAPVLVFEPSFINFQAEYKVVVAFPSADVDGAYEFEIYSSTDNSWKISPELSFGKPTWVLDRNGVHLNGAVYWLCNDSFLLRFDLKLNRATVIPCYLDPLAAFGTCLAVIDGKLCTAHRAGRQLIVSVLSNVNGNTMQMSYEDKVWENQVVPLETASNESLDVIIDEVRVLAMGSDVIVFHDGWSIFSYNRKTKVTTSIGNGSEYNTNCIYLPYVNNLVSLQ